MRKLIFGINITIDGCCDHTKGISDDEVHNYFTRLNDEADVVVYGRKTYELMVPFWPDIAKNPSGDKSMDDYAQLFVSLPHLVVCSRSLSTVEGKNTTLIREDLANEVLKLKRGIGKSILTGGVDIPSQLMAAGIVDEIRLVVHPVIAGKGRRLFDEMEIPQNLGFELAETKTFASGCIALRYIKK